MKTMNIKMIKILSGSLMACGLISVSAFAQDMDVTMDVVRQHDAQQITDRVMNRIDLPDSAQDMRPHGIRDQDRDRLHSREMSHDVDGSQAAMKEESHQMHDDVNDAREESHRMREDVSDAREESHQMREDVNDVREESHRMREDVNDVQDDVRQMRENHELN